ncbi:T9SS C-terminal target domain-containing protein [Flammeovirga pectinis]|uniref:T9SS C-terminal target domain-containing protein n=1 Tax=Flammeovirga pectinis TaxID=2494373 RepID=UPI0014771122|nr:T9SS C-terminal target domain-containing protein [Flammeovirga pectinis]
MCFLGAGLSNVSAQTNATIEYTVQRYIGDVSELDRAKYFNLHSNSQSEEHTAFYKEFNVSPSRGFWGAFSFNKISKKNPVGVYPTPKNSKNKNVRDVQHYVGTEHPKNVFKDGIDPEVVANWSAEYFKNFSNNDLRPQFLEPMNEPFVHAHDFYEGKWIPEDEARIKKQMSEVFSAIGAKIHATPELANMKVVGYSAAWPSFERKNFQNWEENMKLFMDIAGENMDGFSTHLYDGVNVTGQDNKRSGSNSEAILDLIEAYSYTKWGVVKPHAITEYGVIPKGFGEGYSPVRASQAVSGINHMIFNLLDRENNMYISIPFITGKSKWNMTKKNNYTPYKAAMMIPTNLGEAKPAGWEYNEKVYFYKQWASVKGKRVYVATDNPDVQIQGFVDGNVLYVALNNLDDKEQEVNLNFNEKLKKLKNINSKSVKTYTDKKAEYTEKTFSKAINSLVLEPSETVVLAYEFSKEIKFDNTIHETKYYSTKVVQEIKANTSIDYTFDSIKTGKGEATLMLGIARAHGKSLKPVVTLNGKELTVPTNWKGYDQKNRKAFFGTIEIVIDPSSLKENNTVSVTFPDAGGHVSSLILELKNYEQGEVSK